MVVVLALDEGGKTMGQGSGVVVGEYEVVTNCHVLGKAADVAVRQAADWSVRETYRMAASLLARNDERDLCLLFVDELPEPPAAQAAQLGAAKVLSVGEEVYAVGAPAGLELSLSRGIVSQLRGAFGKRSAPLVQTDAAISPGSSGGGLFNQAGELVGITTFKWRGESLNFALPAEWIEELRAQGRSKLMEAKRRVECPKNPTYECVIDLALGTANSINDHHVLAAFLFRGIGEVQAEAGDGSAARQSFAVAIKASSGIDDTISLRVLALNAIARAQAEAGDIASGLRTAHGIHDAEERVMALYGIAGTQAKAGDGEAAKQTFAVAIKAAHDIDDARSRIRNLSRIAIAQAEAGDIAGGLRTAHGIHDAEERVRALYGIARVQAKAGDLQAARRTVDSALALEKGHDKYVMGRGYNLQEIAIIQAEAGDIAAALSTTRNLRDGGLSDRRTEALRQLVTEHAKKDDIALIIKAAHAIENAQNRAAVLGDIAKKQAALGDRHASGQTFATALKIAHAIDRPRDRAEALCEIATAQTEAGDRQAAKPILATALKAAHDIKDDWWRSNASKDIAVAQAKAGDIATALEIAQPIDEPLYRAEALRDIATVQAKTGNGQAAKRTFSAAFRAARVIRAAIFRVESLCEIATAQMEAEHGAQADQTFSSALKAAHAHAIDEPDYSAIVSNDIMEFITAQAKAGDIAAAVRNAHSVEGAGFGSRALVDIAAMQAEEGDFEHAMAIALHIESAFDRAWALAKIARRLAAVK